MVNVGYRGFFKIVCILVNNVICYGIFSEGKVFKDGDIINIDVIVIKDGWYGDISCMYFVGILLVMVCCLVEIMYEVMWCGICVVCLGVILGDIGYVI